jgi:hypothetical protein
MLSVMLAKHVRPTKLRDLCGYMSIYWSKSTNFNFSIPNFSFNF